MKVRTLSSKAERVKNIYLNGALYFQSYGHFKADKLLIICKFQNYGRLNIDYMFFSLIYGRPKYEM